MKRMIKLFLVGLSLFFLVGCAVSQSRVATGLEFEINNLVLIRPGMTVKEVVKLLGKPYAIGKEINGSIFYQYEWIITKATAAGGGIVVMGFTGSQSLSGGKAKIIFDEKTLTVKSVHYEVLGVENYKKLKGGQYEKKQ